MTILDATLVPFGHDNLTCMHILDDTGSGITYGDQLDFFEIYDNKIPTIRHTLFRRTLANLYEYDDFSVDDDFKMECCELFALACQSLTDKDPNYFF